MGIYDRDYYRKEGPSILDTFVNRGRVCRWLLIINIAVFVMQLLTRPDPMMMGLNAHSEGAVTDWLVLDTQRVMQGEVWRLLTYAFLHSTWIWQHIVFNMLFLWWFGSDMEDHYGSREFLTFYLVAAVLGGLAYQVLAVMEGRPAFCLGASGAVTAAMVLCACHYPQRMILLFFLLPVPIWLFVVFQVAQDAFIFLGGIKTTTAVSVHLAGAAFGFAYYKFQWRLIGSLPSFSAWRRRRSRPKLRVFHGDDDDRQPAGVTVQPRSGDIDEQLEAKLDAVLAKIERSGKASLTESENAILQRASEVYKRRRS